MNAYRTWHYGLIAEWWAEFNTDGPEIDYFGRFVERGQPALDAGCGTGRLLLPWLRAGYDVDGAGRLRRHDRALPRPRAARGLRPDAARAAAARARSAAPLPDGRRLRRPRHRHDARAGPGRADADPRMPRAGRRAPPRQRSAVRHRVALAALAGERPRRASGTVARDRHPQAAADGSEYELASRVAAVDPLDQTEILEMRARKGSGASSSRRRSTQSRCARSSGTRFC